MIKHIAQTVAVAVAYWLGAQIGLELALVNSQVTPLWPPTGIALIAMLVLGMRHAWPGVAMGAIAVNAPLGAELTTGLITVGNVLAPLTAAWLLSYLHFRMDIDRVRDAVALIFPAAMGSMMISATFGATALTIAGAASFWETWIVWWTGDAMGVLLIAPVLLLFRRARFPIIQYKRWPEATVAVLITGAVTVVGGWHEPHMLFLAFPFLVWAVFRFQLAGSAICALTASVVATTAASTGAAPFAGNDLWNNMLVLQTFNGALAISALLISALMEERNAALWQVVRGNKDLNDVVGFLSHGKLTENQEHELEDIAVKQEKVESYLNKLAHEQEAREQSA